MEDMAGYVMEDLCELRGQGRDLDMEVKRKDSFSGDQRCGKGKAWGEGRGRQEERSSS